MPGIIHKIYMVIITKKKFDNYACRWPRQFSCMDVYFIAL